MPTLTSEHRTTLWAARQAGIERLALARLQLAATCGCPACGDADTISELRALISRQKTLIEDIGNRISQRVSPLTPTGQADQMARTLTP